MIKSDNGARSAAAYDDAARVAQYDAKMNLMHPNRVKMAEMVCAMLPFAAQEKLTLLDLGTGTGFLTAYLLQAFPHAHIIAVDGALAMMQQAQARLREKAQALTWHICTFQELARNTSDLPALDAVVSCFALHHLSAEQKRELYHAVLPKLRVGGWLLNADIVALPDTKIEARYQYLRCLGIQQRARQQLGEERTLAAIAAELAQLEHEDGDQPLPLEEDLRLLREAGFQEVDCFWKETREAVWGGIKLE
ncbi:MAG: methyltransferase domain-containing protein [candidate division KSB1 bacterium]